ncbi:ECF transporter S component [Tuberibacillus sp. Marseille-P3662]|uniref:ECF transporter S component n=1 Tax=Tuberibacillus sp. Marseille-P3662 TaxID=1965358 RepID=UPI000A1CB9DA|nr:ECF transporter S component [Tuberibacillus sp. Marseille-P3662]
MRQTSTQQLISTALLGSIAFIIYYIAFPLPLFPQFLTIDFSDLPAVIGAIMYGPVAGITIEALKNILHWLAKGNVTGVPIGEFANFLAGSILVVVTSFIYRRKQNKTGLVLGLITGTLLMAVAMAVANYYFIFPGYAMFLGVTIEQSINLAHTANSSIHSLMTLIVYGVTPFNIIKGLLLALIMMPVYLRLQDKMKKWGHRPRF